MNLEAITINFLQRDIVGRPVVELGRARRLVGRDVGGRFERAAVFQVHGDAGSAEAVVGDAAFEAGRLGTALDDTEGVDAAHALDGELVGATARGAEEGRFWVLLQAGRRDVGVEVHFSLVVAGDFMEFSALFMEPQPSAFALEVVVLDEHPDRSGHPCKTVEHGGDERTVAQSDQ